MRIADNNPLTIKATHVLEGSLKVTIATPGIAKRTLIRPITVRDRIWGTSHGSAGDVREPRVRRCPHSASGVKRPLGHEDTGFKFNAGLQRQGE